MTAAAGLDTFTGQESRADDCHQPAAQGSTTAPMGTTSRAAMPHRVRDRASAPTRPSGAPVMTAAANQKIFELKDPSGMRPVSSPKP